ncbi:MAG: amidohydrolase family protein [Patescibacteria group bacterium]|nr:amidohydrolase family protein [Patescibacteria group bacterium]
MLSIEGKIINHDSEIYGRVEINQETGLIKSVGEATGSADIVCGEDCLVFPGFVDLHVHAREDVSGLQNYKEDFLSASEAAINGGVTHICDMPNNPVAPVDEKSYGEKLALAEKALVDVTLYGGIGPKTKPFSCSAPIYRPSMQPINGHITTQPPYKAFMGPSIGDLFFHSQQELEEAIKRYEGQYVSFHCEDPEILEANKNQPTHEQRRPAEAELKATDFALYLIEKYRLHGKLCHYSVKEGLAKIISAKKAGLDVACEVAPHHLYFDDTMLTEENRKWLQMNPPLRAPEDRLAMIEALRKGDIDFLATDHAPHTAEEKLKGMSGVPHLDTYGAFAAWLLKECNFEPQDIARICSFNPGRFVNSFRTERCGEIKEGFAGSLTILDLSQKWLVKKENLKTKCGWSPFTGRVFPGKVKCAIVRGRVYNNTN